MDYALQFGLHVRSGFLATELAWTEPYHADHHALVRPYLLFCIAQHLLSVINPNSAWR